MNTIHKRSKHNRGEIGPETLRLLGITALIVGAFIGIYMVLTAETGAGPGGYIGKLLLVVRMNFGFWFLIIIAAGFGVYRKLTNPGNFTWTELPLQLAVSVVTLILLFAFFFSTAANLSDLEVWNGYVQKAEYYEEWTERVETRVCTSTDKDGHCTSWRTDVSYIRHPPTWSLHTTAGNLNVGRQLYQTYVRYFGNEQKTELYHMNQSSFGDGDMYYVTYQPGFHKVVPASQEHLFVNYLRASDSIKKIQGNLAGFQGLLRPYPRVYEDEFGNIQINRVVEAGVSLPKNWKYDVDKTLDEALTTLGATKEVNVLVYVVRTSNHSFIHALAESWVNGKKNDVIVILGMQEFPKISFAHVMAWTKIEEFKIVLRDRILNCENLADGKAFANLIVEEVAKPPLKGGFKRMPMAELQYLVSGIRLPWWCQLLIVIIGGAVSWFTSKYFIENGTRE